MTLGEHTFHMHLNWADCFFGNVPLPYRKPSKNVSTVMDMAYGFEWSAFQPRFFIYVLCHSRMLVGLRLHFFIF